MFLIFRYLFPLCLWLPFLTAGHAAESPVTEQARSGLTALYIVLAIPVIAALIFAIRFIMKNVLTKKPQTTLREDYRREAEEHERSGRYITAAKIYENQLKETRKAANLYEKGNDLKRAAALYNILGMSTEAREAYEKAGDFDSAAEIFFLEGNYEEAAKLYHKSGKKTDAALAMERAGRKLPAARLYREAGDYKRAAQLLEEEGMLKEAAEMYGFSVAGRDPDAASVQDFYTAAVKFEKTGETEVAIGLYRKIDDFDPTFRDVRERLHALAATGEKEEIPEGRTTLRSFIRSGSLEPKHCLKIWVQILRALKESYQQGRPYGLMTPDNILIDAQNTVSFLSRPSAAAYIAPEKERGFELDTRADIYSAGVILYEMLTGSLQGIGSTSVADVAPDVPEWLDEMVIRCMRKVREDRYQGIDDIFADIKLLSSRKKESGDS